MKQHQPTLRRLPGLGNEKNKKRKTKNFFSSAHLPSPNQTHQLALLNKQKKKKKITPPSAPACSFF
jgi:hypothetical protein